MTEPLLSVTEVIALETISQQAVQKRIDKGSLSAYKIQVKGRKGFEYRIPLSALSNVAQRRYYAKQKAEADDCTSDNDEPYREQMENERTLEDLTAEQREQVSPWRQILSHYGIFIGQYPKKTTEMTKVFAEQAKEQYPHLHISARTIYAKQKALREQGEVALADRRKEGNRLHKGNILKPEVKAAFEQYWLDENRPAVTVARRLVNDWAKLEHPELLPLPSIATFNRYASRIDKPLIQYFRYGNKAFEDKCLPYVERDYSRLESNEIWEADYHTLDFWVRDDITGAKFRPHLIVWIDVKSRKIMSYGLYKSANSDGTIITLRKGIEKYGIPQNVYLDNGREFLSSDFGGRGQRKTDDNADYGSTILSRLGIKMHNAKVANGKAKLVERYFKEVKENFSRLIPTYTGGKPEERPERLEDILKNEDEIPLLSRAMELTGLFIEGIYNVMPSQASGLKGKSPNEYYRENLVVKKTATQSDLELMLLRTARLQTVSRNGVKLKIAGEEIWYYATELAMNWQGKKVYVRYNPEDLQQVRIYNEKEQFITTANLKMKGGYDFYEGTDIDAIKAIHTEHKRLKKAVKSYKQNLASIIEVPEATEIIERTASIKLANESPIYNAPILEPVRYQENGYQQAAGEATKIDFNAIVERLTGGEVKYEKT